MVELPLQIVTVTRDHSTLYVRLPADYVKRKGIKRRDLMVCRQGKNGEITYSTFIDEVNHGKKTDDGKDG